MIVRSVRDDAMDSIRSACTPSVITIRYAVLSSTSRRVCAVPLPTDLTGECSGRMSHARRRSALAAGTSCLR